jgi:hypothetical protein
MKSSENLLGDKVEGAACVVVVVVAVVVAVVVVVVVVIVDIVVVVVAVVVVESVLAFVAADFNSKSEITFTIDCYTEVKASIL